MACLVCCHWLCRVVMDSIAVLRVFLDNGTWPNVDYIWKYRGQNASCILADNKVCATYTSYFNGRGATVVIAQSKVPRCFQYTWLGPRWNNESIFLNATCQDATRLASGVPCVHPLVVSYDGTWPDVDYIWTNHGQSASCILASNDVCATYTYYFNGHVENSTSMCTRAVNRQGNAITNGCYTQRNGSYVTTACFCRSVPGGVPCNDSYSHFLSDSIFIFCLGFLMYINYNFEYSL